MVIKLPQGHSISTPFNIHTLTDMLIHVLRQTDIPIQNYNCSLDSKI